jgi:hypothetical protein
MGPWIENREEFNRQYQAKLGKNKGGSSGFGKSKGKSYGGSSFGKGKGGFGGRFPQQAKEATDLIYFADATPAKAELNNNVISQSSLAGSTEKCLVADGYAVFDPGCTKACMSEHARRGLVAKLEANGIPIAESNRRESHTTYSFADGEGKRTKPGFKSDITVLMGGKRCKSEWEILSKGKTAPLLSLPQAKNLNFDVKFRPEGCFVTSAPLGWKNKM